MIVRLRKSGGWGRIGRRVALPAAGVSVFLLFLSATASAQIQSGAGAVTLAANLPSSLTVTATPSLVSFALIPSGVSTGNSVVSITTRWSLATIVSRLSLYAYFASPASALSDGGGHNIPSTNVSGSVNGGAFTTFTGASPFSGNSSITVFSRVVLGFNRPQQRTDTINLRISTVGLTLPAANYTGLLVIQAQAL